MNDIEKWKFKRMLASLRNMKGNGTSLISLIIKSGAQIALTTKILTVEYGTASNIKSRVNRLSVLTAITSVQHALKKYKQTPANGLAIFCGIVMTEDGKEKKVNISFEPPNPINKPLYKCDKEFHTDYLEELILQKETYGFIIVSGTTCMYATVNGNSKRVLYEFSENIPGKTRRGGQSALRFSRLRDEAVHNFIRKIGEGATKYFIENNMPNVIGIVLAGSADRKQELERSELLDPRLKKIIINRVDTSYGGLNGLTQAIQASQDCLSDIQLAKEKQIISEYMNEISKDTDLYCFGLKQTFNALEAGAVQKLLVWDELPAKRLKYRTMDGKEYTDFLTDKEIKTLEIAEIMESDLLSDWLAENYKDYGAELHIVSDSTDVGSQFSKGFGGIGGILRWRIDLSVYEEPVDDDFDEFDDFM